MTRFIILFLLFLFTVELRAQAPNKFSYQAVIRNSKNIPVVSSNIGIRISILKGSPTGDLVYAETQNPMTSQGGLISIQIGDGTVVSGEIEDIDWSDGPYFINSEVDPEGGDNYVISGTTEILSVPFSLHANYADSTHEEDPVYINSPARTISADDITKWNNMNSKRSITFDVLSAYTEGDAYKNFGTTYFSGLKLDHGKSSIFALNFTIPENYVPGEAMVIRIVCSNSNVGSVSLLPNVLSVARPGEGFIASADATTGLAIEYPIIFEQAQHPREVIGSIVSPDNSKTLQPGDAITFSFYRSSAEFNDTSGGVLVIHSIEITY